MRTRRIAALLVFLAVPSLLLSQQSPTKKDELPHPKIARRIQSAAKKVLEAEHVPGAGIALVSNAKFSWCGGIGKADLSQNRDITCDTEFASAPSAKRSSLSRSQTRRGRPHQSAIPLAGRRARGPGKNPWESTNPVRITNLLEHTAGFDDMALREVYNTRDSPNISILQVLQNSRIPKRSLASQHSLRLLQSRLWNRGYLVEKVSGQPWTSYVRSNILTPLEISTGDFDLTPQNRALLAQGYQRPEGKLVQPVAYKGNLSASRRKT